MDQRKNCRGCKFSGWDPDGPYCTEPNVAREYPYGAALHTRVVADRCPAPSHPHYSPREVSK